MDRRIRSVPVLKTAAAIALLAGVLAPSLSSGADIAWIQTNISRTATSDGSTSTCQADFRNGDRASVSSTCKYGAPDAIGWATWTCESEYRFKDGSSFLFAFKGGTGRYKDMSGAAFGVGYAGKMQWNGSYSTAAAKP